MSLIFVLRLPSITSIAIDWDESVYFIVAQDIANGGVPYQTSFDHKGPILYFLLVPVINLFGNSIFALRLFTTLYLLFSMFFVHLIAKRLFQEKIYMIASLIYGLFFTTSNLGGLASNAEIFMMLPAIVAMLCFINYMQITKYSYTKLFLCGLLSAMAIFIKPSIAFTVVIFPIVLIIKKLTEKSYSWSIFLKEIFWYLFGFVVISIIIFGYFALHNAITDFYYGFYLFNKQYVNTISYQVGLKRLFSFLYRMRWIDFITVLAYGSGLFIALKFLKKKIPENKKFITFFVMGLTFLSMIGVYSGRNMFSHYFLQMSLAFSFLIPLAISLIQIKVEDEDLNKIIYTSFLILILFPFPISDIKKFLINHKNNVHYKIAEYIKANTTEQDTIFVLGGQPIIYFLSERKAPTKYFHWLYHYGKFEEILKIEKPTLRSFSYNKPKYFVFMDNDLKVIYLEKFMADNYHFETKFADYLLYKAN